MSLLLNDSIQNIRYSFLRIVYVPKLRPDNMDQILRTIFNAVGWDITYSRIEYCYRTAPKNNDANPPIFLKVLLIFQP